MIVENNRNQNHNHNHNHNQDDNLARRMEKLGKLSKRELEVLRLICEGLSYEEVAGKLFISKTTVQFHMTRIHVKLGLEGYSRGARQVELGQFCYALHTFQPRPEAEQQPRLTLAHSLRQGAKRLHKAIALLWADQRLLMLVLILLNLLLLYFFVRPQHPSCPVLEGFGITLETAGFHERRAVAHYQTDNYPYAVQDNNWMLARRPPKWAYYGRGLSHHKLQQHEQATTVWFAPTRRKRL